MDSQHVKRLEQILAHRRQVVVPNAEIEPVIGEEEYAAPTVEPTTLPLEVMMQDSPEKISIDGAPTETVSKISVEGCSEKDSIEVARMEKAIDNSKKDLATMMETEKSLKMVTPTGCFVTSTSHAGPSDSIPRDPSTEESLQSTAEYLKN